MPKCLHRLISLLGVAGSLASLSPVSAQSLTDFTIRHETVGAQDPTGVVWWQDMWYAVGRGGAVYRSADGVAWNASMMLLRDADGIAQRNTANGPDKLVANENTIVGIGEGGRIFRTVDGEVWDAIASPTGETDLNAIAYANGEWHIVGDAGTLLRSRDEGLTWEQFSPNLERDWDAQNFRDVAYAQDNWWIADGNDVYRGQGVGLFELETMPGDVRWRTLYGDLLNDRVWAAGDQTIAYKDSDSGAWSTRNLVGSEGFMTTIVVTDEDVLVGDSGNRFWSAGLLTMAFQPFVFNVGNSFRDATDAAFNGTQTIILTERSDFGSADFIWTTEDFETFNAPMVGLNTRFFAATLQNDEWFVGGDGRFLARSEDGEFWQTWSTIELPEPYTGIQVDHLRYFPNGQEPGFWLLGATVQEPFLFNSRIKGALFRSADAGESWQLVYAHPTDRRSEDLAAIVDIIQIGASPSRLLATVGEANSSFLGEGVVLRSEDLGETWQVATETQNLPMAILLEENDTIVYEGTYFLQSRDTFNWERTFVNFPGFQSHIILDAEPFNGETLLLVSDAFGNERFLVYFDGVNNPEDLIPVGNFLEGGERLFRLGEAMFMKSGNTLVEVLPDLSLGSSWAYPDPAFTVGFNNLSVRDDEVLIVGDGVLAMATLEASESDPVKTALPTADGPVDGWYQLPVFGWFFPTAEFPWVQHTELGAIFLTASGENFTFYRPEGGWFLVVPSIYPYFYSYSANSWVYYLEGTSGNWYFDYGRNDWVQAPDL